MGRERQAAKGQSQNQTCSRCGKDIAFGHGTPTPPGEPVGTPKYQGIAVFPVGILSPRPGILNRNMIFFNPNYMLTTALLERKVSVYPLHYDKQMLKCKKSPPTTTLNYYLCYTYINKSDHIS